MTLSTNWEDVYQLVDDFPWVQFYSTGWAYSLMRHMNAACRIANLIGPESLSVTYLVQYMSEFSTLTDTLGIPFLESVRPFLMYEGMVLDDDYQRLFAQFLRLPAIPLPTGIRRFVVTDMRVHTLDLYRNAEEFETKFIYVMRYSPVTASIPNYASLSEFLAPGNFPENKIYCPTITELLSHCPGCHAMFATGIGKSQGVPYVRFRDSSGLIDGGFMHVELGMGVIDQFVELIGAYIMM
ncbi:BnaAnng15840D [Brassica napus]|uniref:(rape) hypothetical protein n=1 Tax=Brassica napus TaxID=3708 RepID=A0A078J4S4_BRANA|nr:unnamed protein product [Brassica napus]CDY59074.1 BnaAnng15840D [Brassica napus]